MSAQRAPSKDDLTHTAEISDLQRMVPLDQIEPPNSDGLTENGARFIIDEAHREQLRLSTSLTGGNYNPVILVELPGDNDSEYRFITADGNGRVEDGISKGETHISAIVLPHGDPRIPWIKYSANLATMPTSAAERANAIGHLVSDYAKRTGTGSASNKGGKGKVGPAKSLSEALPLSKKQINKLNAIFLALQHDGLRRLAGTGYDRVETLKKISELNEKDQLTVIEYAENHQKERLLSKALNNSNASDKAQKTYSAGKKTSPVITLEEQRIALDEIWDRTDEIIKTDWLKTNGFVLVDIEADNSTNGDVPAYAAEDL